MHAGTRLSSVPSARVEGATRHFIVVSSHCMRTDLPAAVWLHTVVLPQVSCAPSSANTGRVEHHNASHSTAATNAMRTPPPITLPTNPAPARTSPSTPAAPAGAFPLNFDMLPSYWLSTGGAMGMPPHTQMTKVQVNTDSALICPRETM